MEKDGWTFAVAVFFFLFFFLSPLGMMAASFFRNGYLAFFSIHGGLVLFFPLPFSIGELSIWTRMGWSRSVSFF